MTKLELIDAVVQRVFCIPDGAAACANGFCNSVCQAKEKCYVSEKSEDQLGYVVSSIQTNIFVEACPGGGKTEIIALKAAYEYQKWPSANTGIAILTFTRNSADVITQRVTRYAGIGKSGYPHFVGTLDSWLHQYLAQPFAHLLTGYCGKGFDHSVRLVDESSTAQWLSAYKCEFPYLFGSGGKTKQIPRYANMVKYDLDKKEWNIQTTKANNYVPVADYFGSPEFQSFCKDIPNFTVELLSRSYQRSKDKFLAAGFATYDDVELISHSLLGKNDLAHKLAARFPLIIVDECQDLSFCQLKILGRLTRAGANLHFVGDLNQAIYEFRKVDPQRVKSFTKAYHFENLSLPDNFRSCQSIVDLSAKLAPSGDLIGHGKTIPGNACVCFSYDKPADLPKIPIQFERYLTSRGIHVDRCAILARGRGTLSKLQSLESQKPAIIYGQVGYGDFSMVKERHIIVG
jgi:DNA helicase-2/ATP-dependent DNA helicase PcrA